jgi:hypothetical protein
MNRITKVITTIAASIISVDVILMVINGTMLYVLLILAGAFKQSAYKAMGYWINTGHLPHKEKTHVKTHN